MYVILEAFREISLPYSLANGRKRVFTFVPGKNKIDKEVLELIIKQNGKDYKAHYFKLIYPFETQFDTGQREHLSDYTEAEMLEIVASVHDVGFLDYLLQLERERKFGYEPRFAVIKAIQNQKPPEEPSADATVFLRNMYENYVVDDEEGMERREKSCRLMEEKILNRVSAGADKTGT